MARMSNYTYLDCYLACRGAYITACPDASLPGQPAASDGRRGYRCAVRMGLQPTTPSIVTHLNHRLYAFEVQHPHILSYLGYPKFSIPALHLVGIAIAYDSYAPCGDFGSFISSLNLHSCPQLEYSHRAIATLVQSSLAQASTAPVGNILGFTCAQSICKPPEK